MRDLVNFFDFIQQADIFLAHIPSKEQEDKTPETLKEHMSLTLYYYEKLCQTKDMDRIVRNVIHRLRCGGSSLPSALEALIYKLFVNAIYLHDAGKINCAFQKRVMKNEKVIDKRGIDTHHSILSALIYIDFFTEEIRKIGDTLLRKYFFNILYSFAYIISRHHGNLFSTDALLESLEKAQSSGKQGALTYYTRESIYDIVTNDPDNSPFGSKKYSQWKMDEADFYILNRLLFAMITSCDYYATYHYQSGTEVDFNDTRQLDVWWESYSQTDLYRSIREKANAVLAAPIESLKMNELRSRIFLDAEKTLLSNIDKHIFYLEAPTGSGKTNTSINLALRLLHADPQLTNVFYIFPFNTLVEQTGKELSKYFKEGKDFAIVNSLTPIILSLKDTEDEDNAEANYEKSYLDRQFFHYPIVATSHINFFNALFGVNRENHFLLGRLCNSIVIIDEIQCYKNLIWREIILMLQKYAVLLNIKIIIMSATLPRLDFMLGENVPGFIALLPNSRKYFQNRIFKNRVKIDTSSLLCTGSMNIRDIANEIIKTYKEKSGKVLIELITKATARELYNLLRLEFGSDHVVELTGDDNKFKRNQTIEKIKAASAIVVVATQVIEAGVDIDMDYGFKNISLLDGEEQFMGRINRSCLKEGCIVYFFMVDEPEKVYKNDHRLQFTLKSEDMAQLLESKDFGRYYEKVMEIILTDTSRNNTRNIEAFEERLLKLYFQKVYEHMKLIENNESQVFLAHRTTGCDGQIIDGRDLWKQYKDLCLDKDMSFAKRKVELSKLYEIMSLFTYSVPYKDAKAFHDEVFGFYYVDHGEQFIDEEGKFLRDKFTEYSRGLFI